MQETNTTLDGLYAGFGCVTEGMDIVDQICADANPTDDNGTISAEEQSVITSIVIRPAETEDDTLETEEAIPDTETTGLTDAE